MNKRDYVSALCAQLKTLPSNDVEEIAKEKLGLLYENEILFRSDINK